MSKIMIVDDTVFMRMLLKDIIIQMGFEVVGEASNGMEALKLYSVVKPDLVTMDIMMPKMDGLMALCKIRKIDPKAKVIMCSAMAQKKIVLDAIISGAKDFIAKPFQEEQVKETIQKVLSCP